MATIHFTANVIILGMIFFITETFGTDSDDQSPTNAQTDNSTNMQNTTETNSSAGTQTDICSFGTMVCCEKYFNDASDCDEEDYYDDEDESEVYTQLKAIFASQNDASNQLLYCDINRQSNPQDAFLNTMVIAGLKAQSCCYNGSNFVAQDRNGDLTYVEDKTGKNNIRVPEMSISPCYDLFFENNIRIYKRNPNKTSECCPCGLTCSGNSANRSCT